MWVTQLGPGQVVRPRDGARPLTRLPGLSCFAPASPGRLEAGALPQGPRGAPARRPLAGPAAPFFSGLGVVAPPALRRPAGGLARTCGGLGGPGEGPLSCRGAAVPGSENCRFLPRCAQGSQRSGAPGRPGETRGPGQSTCRKGLVSCPLVLEVALGFQDFPGPGEPGPLLLAAEFHWSVLVSTCQRKRKRTGLGGEGSWHKVRCPLRTAPANSRGTGGVKLVHHSLERDWNVQALKPHRKERLDERPTERAPCTRCLSAAKIIF